MDTKAKMLRLASALHNACVKNYKKKNCDGCPFTVSPYGGCNLYEHPLEWERKLKEAKEVKNK